MFKNYFKTAIRNLKRNKSYTIINTSGLAVGIAACLLLFLVIQFETSFDNFHTNNKNIYRIGTEMHSQDGLRYTDGSAFPVGKSIRLDFPQIKQVASIFKNEGQITVNNGTSQPLKLKENNFYYADPDFFSIFNFPFLAGSAPTSLSNPNNAILTQATAEKYFGNWKFAIGKTIKYENTDLYTITGIIKNVPTNTDFPLGVIVPFSALEHTYIKDNLNDWVSIYGGAYTFVVLPDNLSMSTFNKELKVFSKKHKPAGYTQDALIAQPLSEMHYDERFGNFNQHTFSHSLINALLLIGIFLIVIACVNFINLATAQAVNRAKEVGVRKVLGGKRKQLALQFIGETALIVLMAICIAVGIAFIALPFLNNLLETQLAISFTSNMILIVFLLIIFISVTLSAGLYPAVILSGFNPITALKSKITGGMVGGSSLRRVLVVVQFAIAQMLIIGMLVVVSQMNLFKNASLGFDKDAVINVPIPGDSVSHTKLSYMRDRLLADKDITNVSFSYGPPSAQGNWSSDFKFNHETKNTDFSANLKWADVDYFKTFNLSFIAGRPYYAGDTVREFVVNETLLKRLGIINPQDAIGKEINFWNGGKVANIVGVVKDFNSLSLRKPVAPIVLSTWRDVYKTISIKIKPGKEKEVLPYVEKLWTSAFPDYAYSYAFLDKTIESFYKQESQLSQLYKIFAGIAIFISCLGLYGLVSFMAVQRTKEVGIRKVLGASIRSIIFLLSKEFTILIVIAFIISAPIAYYLMHEWLQSYTYRISLGITIFSIAIISSVVIAWVTVAHRAIKAAMANPVKSLRTE